MAINILEKPYSVTRAGQPLILTASSTNTANAGFRMVVRVDSGITEDFYIAPNNFDVIIFNLMQVLSNKFYLINSAEKTTIANIATYSGAEHGYLSYELTLFEAWEVDGLLTIDEASQVDVQAEEDVVAFRLLQASYTVGDGYRPDPSLTYGFAAGATPTTSTRLLMGDRDSNTHPLIQGLPFIDFAPANYVAQPVRAQDWGVINLLTGYQNGDLPLGAALWVRYTLVEEDLTFQTYDEQLTGNARLVALPAYPANLNLGGIGTVIPNNFAGYKFYTIQLFNQDPAISTGRQALSALYIYYPVDGDCNHDNVRLCWWSPNKGGYDYFNFNKLNEESVSVERKRMNKIIGEYDAPSFSLNPAQGGLTELAVKPTTSLEISTDWISEGEFKLISNIVKSKSVWIVSDEDGALTPVVVETNSFLSERKRDGKLKRATLRVQMANENYYY